MGSDAPPPPRQDRSDRPAVGDRAPVTEGIDVDGKPFRLNWRNLFDDKNGPIHRAWGVRQRPTYFVIDAKGVIRAADAENLDGAVVTVLEEMGKK